MVTQNFDKNAVFGYLTAKRLYPNYVFFSKKYDFGNSAVLEEYLRELKIKISNTLYPLDFAVCKNRIDSVTPAPENYDTVLSSAALDACGAIYELASYLEDGDKEHIESTSTFATDSVDMYIQEKENLDMNNKKLEETIAFHPLMIRERKMQKDIWDYLNRTDTIDESDIETLERLQHNDGMGNLDLPN